MLELNPNYPIACSFLAEAYEQKGDFVSAIATIEKIQQATTDPLTLSTVGYVYAKSGDRDKALEILLGLFIALGMTLCTFPYEVHHLKSLR